MEKRYRAITKKRLTLEGWFDFKKGTQFDVVEIRNKIIYVSDENKKLYGFKSKDLILLEEKDIDLNYTNLYEAIKYVQNSYCDVNLNQPYLLIGNVAELIKILTGRDIKPEDLTFNFK